MDSDSAAAAESFGLDITHQIYQVLYENLQTVSPVIYSKHDNCAI